MTTVDGSRKTKLQSQRASNSYGPADTLGGTDDGMPWQSHRISAARSSPLSASVGSRYAVGRAWQCTLEDMLLSDHSEAGSFHLAAPRIVCAALLVNGSEHHNHGLCGAISDCITIQGS
jgi:hypothetical protein